MRAWGLTGAIGLAGCPWTGTECGGRYEPCVDDTGDHEPVELQREDEGVACVVAGESAFEIEVTLEDCASSCIEGLLSSCEVTRDGAVLDVTARADYTVPAGPCDGACLAVTARCETRHLDPDAYVLRYAGGVAALVVPADPGALPVCAGDGSL
jgi:hypothetical protein